MKSFDMYESYENVEDTAPSKTVVRCKKASCNSRLLSFNSTSSKGMCFHLSVIHEDIAKKEPRVEGALRFADGGLDRFAIRSQGTMKHIIGEDLLAYPIHVILLN